MKSPPQRVQYAALPYRWAAGGEAEILLITSRRSRRWIIPKGWPMPDRPPHRAAALEALEEAGVTGEIGAEPLGSYCYRKRLKDGSKIVCEVEVFPLRVTGQLARWPEEGQRMVKWFSPARAGKLVQQPMLKAAFLSIPVWAAERPVRSARRQIWVDELRLLFERMVAKSGSPIADDVPSPQFAVWVT